MKTWTKITAVMAFLASTSSAVAEDVVIRFSNYLPATHYILTEMIEPWMERVEEATEGRVTFQIQPALGAPAAHVDLVSTGVADLAFVPHSYTPARFKLTEIGELPFTSDDALTNSIAYWRTYQKFMLDANEHRGVKLLGFWTTTPQQVFVDKETTTLAGLKGMKIRIAGPALEQVADLLDFAPITASSSEIYELMSRGTVDGTFFQSDSVVSFRLSDFVKSQISVPGGFGHSSQMLIMNQAKWDRISPEDQARITALSGEAMATAFAKVWDEKAKMGDEELAAKGVKVTTIEGEELDTFKADLMHLREDWVESANKLGVDGAAALEYYDSVLKELSDQ